MVLYGQHDLAAKGGQTVRNLAGVGTTSQSHKGGQGVRNLAAWESHSNHIAIT